MKEQIARYIKAHYGGRTWDWDAQPDSVKLLYLGDAQYILSRIIEAVKEIENPYIEGQVLYLVFEDCRQAVITLLESKDESA